MLAAIIAAASSQNISTAYAKRGNILTGVGDTNSGAVKYRFSGMNTPISKYGITKEMLKSDSVVNVFGMRLIEEYSKKTGIQSANVKIHYINRMNLGLSAMYQQMVNGISIEGSEIGFSIGIKGDIFSFGATVFSDVQCVTTPSMSASDALSVAKRDFGGEKIEIIERPALCILPEEQGNGYAYKLTWKFTLNAIGPPARTYRYFVSAENGKIVRKENQMRE